MSTKHKFTPEQVAAAIHEARGIQSVAARRLGCSRETLRRYVNQFATVRTAVEDARDGLLDFAESKLLKLIDDENITAIIFYLKTQGKKRGYVERVEQTGADGAAVQVIVRYADE